MWLNLRAADIRQQFVIGVGFVTRIGKLLLSRVRAGAFVAPVMMVASIFSLIHKIESRLSYLILRVWNSHVLSRVQASGSRCGIRAIRFGMVVLQSGTSRMMSALRNLAGK